MVVEVVHHASNAELVAYSVMSASGFVVLARLMLWASWRIIGGLILMAILALLGGYALSAVGDASASLWDEIKKSSEWFGWLAGHVFRNQQTIIAAVITAPLAWMAVSLIKNR